MRLSFILKYGISFATLASGASMYIHGREMNDTYRKFVHKTTALASMPTPTTIETTRWDENWDRRAHETPTATRHLILINHGQDVDHYLTKLGREQSILTGKRLKALGIDKKISRVIESSMARAKETNMLICREINLDDSFIEIESSDLLKAGTPVEPDPVFDVACGASFSKPQAFFLDGARIETAFRQFIHRADAEQENVICYFVCRALQLPLEALLRMSVAHTSITQLYIWPNGCVFLKGLGVIGHIPADKVTYDE